MFAHATDEYLLVRPDLDEAQLDALTGELAVPAIETTIGGAGTVGALAVGNTHGIVVSSRITESERARLADAIDGELVALPGGINAAGNVILANNTGAYVHPELSADAVDRIEQGLGVPVLQGSLADVRTVGTAGIATDRGVLCHPQTSDEELTRLADHLDVYADIGTVNYGGPLVGSGLIANTAGFVAGADTTGPELGRIEETLGYLESPAE